jgi:OmcA/MtrC family decaheme c-type cytochrome
VIKFRIKKTISGVTSNVTTLNGTSTPLTGFTSGPSLYIAFAVPQDGIAAPADFNVYLSASLATIAANPLTSTTLSNLSSLTADANGYFTATLYGTAAQPIVVPANATLVTGVVLGGFTQTGTFATQSTGSIVNPAILSRIAMKALDGTAGRRAVVQTAKCDSCHAQLGTDPSFHGGARNDPQACNLCHNGNRTSSGWAADSKYFVHAVHGATKRSVPLTWVPTSVDDNYSNLGYPGLLKDCNQCHLPGTVNFASTAAVVPNMLWSSVATGKFVNVAGSATNRNITKYSYVASGAAILGGTAPAAGCYPSAATATAANPSIQTALNAFGPSPYVAKGIDTASATDYGVGFTTNFNTTVSNACTASGVAYQVAANGGVRQADLTTLVNSPITSACSSCHDTTTASLHMKQNGGVLYATRASVGGASLVNTETCLTCHGAGKVADAAAIHGAK